MQHELPRPLALCAQEPVQSQFGVELGCGEQPRLRFESDAADLRLDPAP
jgi:hypothetical protein